MKILKLKIDYEKIHNNVGLFLEDESDVLNFIKNTMDYLYTHNKNYNQQQWIKLQDLKEIVDNIEVTYGDF